MELSPAYLQWREETLQKGRLEGRRLMVKNLLKHCFGTLDDALQKIIDPLSQLSPEESASFFFQLSREEFLARFGSPSTKLYRLPIPKLAKFRKAKPAKK